MINRKSYLIQAGLFLLIAILGCETKDIDPITVNMGYNYYPLEVGNYWEYKIYNIKYITIGDHDTLNYFSREEVIDSALNAEGVYTYILSVSSKDSLHHSWKLDSLWKVEKNSKFVRKTEDNIPYVKLVFPIADGITWDGNAYNSLKDEEYEIFDSDKSYQLEDTTYSETVTIMQEDIPDTIVNFILKYEIFAKDVGLIFKESKDIVYCSHIHCIGMKQIDHGFNIKQELIKYGKE